MPNLSLLFINRNTAPNFLDLQFHYETIRWFSTVWCTREVNHYYDKCKKYSSFTRKEADYLTTKMLSMEKFDNGIRIF